MSELIDTARKRKNLLKEMILKLHDGETAEAVRSRLSQLLGSVPYGDVVEVEQELIREGMPVEEIQKLCDLHSDAMKGVVDSERAGQPVPGHPVHTFYLENRALEWEIGMIQVPLEEIRGLPEYTDVKERMEKIRSHFHALTDLDKHYRRKENLVFPHLEKRGIDGPPSVMWGKHDEVREHLKNSLELLGAIEAVDAGEAVVAADSVLVPALEAIEEMIYKEENIFFPMCLDTLTEEEWVDIYDQSLEIGFCLVDPREEWKPEGVKGEKPDEAIDSRPIQLPSGSFSASELTVLLNTIPFDLTFVDKDDTVRYFTQGNERIFDRNRSILGRKVQLCHPPSSVHIVQTILDDFKSGRRDRAAFWLTLKGRFVMIEYFALRDAGGEYIGTLEVSQDLTEKRSLTGEQRLLSYDHS